MFPIPEILFLQKTFQTNQTKDASTKIFLSKPYYTHCFFF